MSYHVWFNITLQRGGGLQLVLQPCGQLPGLGYVCVIVPCVHQAADWGLSVCLLDTTGVEERAQMVGRLCAMCSSNKLTPTYVCFCGLGGGTGVEAEQSY